MKRLFNAALLYLILGAAAGVFYREFSKTHEFPEEQFTQLGVVHTHLLALGFLVFLIILALEKLFVISESPKLFGWFFWLYNIGLLVTVAMLVWHGSLTVLGENSNAMIAGIAGLGHILLTAGLVIFLVALRRAVVRPTQVTHETIEA